MKNGLYRPRWKVLYLFTVVVFGLFWMEATSPFSEVTHRLIEIGLVLLLFGLMIVWLKINKLALLMEEQEKYKLDRRADQIPSDTNKIKTKTGASPNKFRQVTFGRSLRFSHRK